MAEREAPPKAVKVRLNTPDELPSLFATNFAVQSTNHEFILTFFEARPPLIIGTAAEQSQQWADLREIDALPLARIVIAFSRVPELLEVLRDGYQRAQGGQESHPSAGVKR